MTTIKEIADERTDFKKGKVDPKVHKTLEIITNGKKLHPLLAEIIKNVTKYHAQLQALCLTGNTISNLLEKLAELNAGALGDAVKSIATTHKHVEDGHSKIAEQLMTSVITAFGAQLPEDQREVSGLERDFKKKREQSLSKIAKCESRCKKAQKRVKKNPDSLQIELKTFEEAIQAHDEMLGETLREASKMQRKRYVHVLKGWLDVIEMEIDLYSISYVELGETQSKVRPLIENGGAGSGDDEAMEKIIKDSKPDQAIDKLREAGKMGSYDSSATSDYMTQQENDHSGNTIRPSGGDVSMYSTMHGNPSHTQASPRGGSDWGSKTVSAAPGGGHAAVRAPTPSFHQPPPEEEPEPADDGFIRVRAKFPYTKQRGDELTFQTGDVFNLIEETTENWWKGDFDGVIGLFPASYVEKLTNEY